MVTMKVEAVMHDGRKLEATGAWGALSDRIAFERRYGISWHVQSKRSAAAMEAQEDDDTRRDERGAFICWRLLRRVHGDAVPAEFDEFVDACQEIILSAVEGLDPTASEAPPTSSQP